MKSDEVNRVHQAVFGYSNGHRLLVSSLSLSSIDVYELAAASDLAPGAEISGSDSYLTGLMLPDSKMFAVMRTWLAPEMPRPGCVWSHVLLLDRAFLSTHVDLTVLGAMFRRPHQYQTDEAFTTAIEINRRLRSGRPNIEAVERVLWACYGDVPLTDDLETRRDTEHAILTIWSQQWPRLRTHFTFRSIPAESNLKGQFFDFRKGISLTKTSPVPKWLAEASKDATSDVITPLRRFLWRYGKDVHSDRKVLPDLIRVYISTRSKTLKFDVADSVLERYPHGQAETLKKDILGLSASKLSLVPSVNSVDLMLLLGKHNESAVRYEEKELVSLFSQVDADHLPDVADALVSSREQLGQLFNPIMDAILPLVNEDILKEGRLSYDIALASVFSNPGLLTSSTTSVFSSLDLLSFWDIRLDDLQRMEILRALLTRDFVDEGAELFYHQPGEIFPIAVDLARQSRLHDSWLDLFRSNVQLSLDSIPVFRDGKDLMATARLLGFPIEPERVLRTWLTAFESVQSSLSHDDESRFYVYLFALCARHGIQNYRDVLIKILPSLRIRVLQNDIPADAEEMLSRWLPSDDARWDLNKRLMKLFRKAYKRGVKMDDVLASLNLSDAEIMYATDQDPESSVRKLFKAFSPFNYWD
ncbi:hypothetical protein ELI36_32955 [Rhizobium ruizarguesonis]|uniref:GAP1-N1 domain-containing protein n=1 Tax=Rhizobium ruizarguesonis TaxID=2081791 RepID=UPI00102F3C3E|nr:hypothetical protein [Rhizobium ruizarguesonis]TAV21350.1 hypothetical protein ELI36_32955 [Rhizobium ruizarguesonis]TAW09978.1 hypothetical protein ELI26_10665 [Rhizobium ruizarguesonis]